MVTARSGLHLCTVLAFVNRLEELANDAGNRGDIRGSVANFKAHEFAAALDISADDTNKLYASLEHPEIGWIADGMIVDFHDRNPDMDDPTALDRQRRHRSRNKILRKLGELARTGFIADDERQEIENQLPQLDHEQLVNLQVELERKSLETIVTRDLRVSQRDSVTPPGDHIRPRGVRDLQNVIRDNVTVTPDQNRQYEGIKSAPIFEAASTESGSLAEEEKEGEGDSNAWLKEKGIAMIMERMGEPHERASVRLSGWFGQLHDSEVLAKILQQAESRSGHSFHMEVTDQIRRLAH